MTMNRSSRSPLTALILGVVAVIALCACGATNSSIRSANRPANYVAASDRLITSGQPTAAQIAALDPLRYRIVINLAPTGGERGSQNEARILGAKGITYVAIPVEVHQPNYRDFMLFSRILDAAGSGRVWVHCQINNRASMFAFLYRVIHEGSDPDTAYEKVTQVWVPTANWLQFASETLAKHNIAYEF